MELYLKIWVKSSFLETEMGKIPCQDCHAGNPTDPDWQTAHKGLKEDPTFPDAEEACGGCHPDIVASAKNSLHYTLAPFEKIIKARANKKDKKVIQKINLAKEKHCNECHASCGQCHVSRPDYAEGGFLDKHNFKKTPPMESTCAACHGGRVYEEFTGLKNEYPADIHYEKEKMACTTCHTAIEMHADASGADNRFELPERPKCLYCHSEIVDKKDKRISHKIHINKLACQVCHSQAYKNCFRCHVGTDKEGLQYFKCRETRILFKIGLNPGKSEERPHDYVVLRHSPADRNLFDFYVKNGLSDFNNLPTWKLATPHNIRRITPQNKECNNCHDKSILFLTNDDISDSEKKANAKVIVGKEHIPKIIEDDFPTK